MPSPDRRCDHASAASMGNQQARQLVWILPEKQHRFTHFIRDNDGTCDAAFDSVFASEGIKVIHTPVRTPCTNAYAEHWVRSVREE